MLIPETVSVEDRVPVPADALWRVLRTGADVDRFLPSLIRSCQVEGSGPGARRTCGTDQGVIEETILATDDTCRLFRYRIDQQALMPLTNYTGLIHVTALGTQECAVLWSASFDLLQPEARDAVAASLQQLFQAGIAGLAALSMEAR